MKSEKTEFRHIRRQAIKLLNDIMEEYIEFEM